MRSIVLLLAAFALLLALGPGPRAYAASTDTGTSLSAHQDPDGCASAMTVQGQTGKHDAGGCAKMNCCLGAICVFASLPATTSVAVPISALALNLSAATTALTGRDVAPPLDPPRSFA